MKIITDLFPVILFFITFKIKGIYAATAVAICASILQIGWVYYKNRKVEPMLWISLGIILVFGGATLLLHDEMFIKWKPSILYWITGSLLLGGELLFRKNAMRGLLGKQLTLPDSAWRTVNISWGVFFAILGFINLAVIYNFSTDAWVNFKLFGVTGLILVFTIAQGAYISSRYKLENKSQEPDK
jgi:intracellular septation protein